MDIKQAFTELGLTQQASQAEAKAAYRTLAMRWHPDVNSGIQTDNRMKVINVAYATVCQFLDTQVRKPAGASQPPSGFQAYDWQSGFKTTGRAKSPVREDCVERTLRVTLFEAAFGCVKRIHGSVTDGCSRCAGRGVASGNWAPGPNCLKCFGTGMVHAPGLGPARTPCDVCLGSGQLKPAARQCQGCQGAGKTERHSWIADVTIHPGTLHASVVQAGDIRARSDASGQPRSFKLTVQIEKHPLFKLDQNRLSVSVPISIWRWLLGGEITVPTLEGVVRVALPKSPTVLLVKNLGWPEPGAPKQRKPLFVLPKIIYPESLQVEDKRMLQVLDVRSHMPEVQGWSRHVQAWMEP